jgi:aminoglycoside 6'-N-acetyltransferase I
MRAERCTFDHLDAWARLRACLWPSRSAEDHRRGLAEALCSGGGDDVAFVARSDTGEVIGFAEAALRHDYVNGCDTSPVLFLEGLYVVPAHRRQGVGRSLCAAVEGWGRSRGVREFASDALADNPAAHHFHAAAGFEETERVVFFRKPL